MIRKKDRKLPRQSSDVVDYSNEDDIGGTLQKIRILRTYSDAPTTLKSVPEQKQRGRALTLDIGSHFYTSEPPYNKNRRGVVISPSIDQLRHLIITPSDKSNKETMIMYGMMRPFVRQ